MNYRLMLLGSTANRAPDNDQGAEFDDVDDGLDEGDEGEEGDGDIDDPDEDDDQGDADDGDADGQPAPRQQTRGQTRFQRLTEERKAEKERADRLEREMADIRRTVSQGPQRSPEELRAERERRLAGMTAEQRLEFLINENAQATERRLNQVAFDTWDANDKAGFAAMAASSPALAAIKTEVEQRLTELRASGQNASRETVAKYLLGEKALNKVGRARTAGRKREQEGRDQHTARPVNGRGDGAPGNQRRTNEREARRKRLEGMSI